MSFHLPTIEYHKKYFNLKKKKVYETHHFDVVADFGGGERSGPKHLHGRSPTDYAVGINAPNRVERKKKSPLIVNATQLTVILCLRARPCDNVVQKATTAAAVIIVVVVVGGGRRGGRYFVVAGVPTCCSRGVRSAFERLAREPRRPSAAAAYLFSAEKPAARAPMLGLSTPSHPPPTSPLTPLTYIYF